MCFFFLSTSCMTRWVAEVTVMQAQGWKVARTDIGTRVRFREQVKASCSEVQEVLQGAGG